jgi:hypothetical protein
MLRLEPTTPCLQSQFGRDRYLRGQATAQVEVAVALSVVVRWGPARTAVNGTVVARPVSRNLMLAATGFPLTRMLVRLEQGKPGREGATSPSVAPPR